mmetsp:Transcript_124797/g.388501  ORF Transcript_124797/g.388501 Transcript_124797/m.388501 type:complete len:607 (-) Transcript_124797:208-2028(-)
MKIELEAIPMLVGFSIGTVFFVSQRLLATRLPPPVPREDDEAEDEEDDETWLAARGLTAADLPVGGPEDPDAIAPKAAALQKEAELSPASSSLSEPMAEPGPEPGPEPAPAQKERIPRPAEVAAARPAQLMPTPRLRSPRPSASFAWQLLFAPLVVLAALAVLAVVTALRRQEPVEQPEQQQQPTEVAKEDDSSSEMNPVTLTLTRQNTPTQVIDGVMYHRSAYWGTLHVGSPPTPFTVVFDTGSGHLILPSTYCHSEVCRARKRYRAKASNTSKSINHDGSEVQPYDMRDQITVSFGTGEVSGVFMEDRLCITPPEPGAVDVDPTRCMPMRMIAATEMSEDPFEEFTFDGVLGLGLLGLSEGTAFNFLSVAAEAMGKVSERYAHTFALYLSDGSTDAEDSEFTLGGYNNDRLDGDLAWNTVLEPQLGQWMIEVKSLRVGNDPIGFCAQGCRAIMDTGTSMLAVPSGVIVELFELLQHQSSNGEDCTGPGPELHFDMDGITLTLEPKDYAHLDDDQWADGSPEESSPANSTSPAPQVLPEPMCKAMLMSMDLPEPVGPKLFILGEPVLRKYYTVYDAKAPPRIGLGLVRKSRRAREEREQELGLRK